MVWPPQVRPVDQFEARETVIVNEEAERKNGKSQEFAKGFRRKMIEDRLSGDVSLLPRCAAGSRLTSISRHDARYQHSAVHQEADRRVPEAGLRKSARYKHCPQNKTGSEFPQSHSPPFPGEHGVAHVAALCGAGKSTYSRSPALTYGSQNFGQFKQARHEKFSTSGHQASEDTSAAIRKTKSPRCGWRKGSAAGPWNRTPRPTAGLCLLLCWDRPCCSA
jgi:hypothetical protein